MSEKQLATYNCTFEMKNLENSFDFVKVGCFELAINASNLLDKCGIYRLTLIVSELDNENVSDDRLTTQDNLERGLELADSLSSHLKSI